MTFQNAAHWALFAVTFGLPFTLYVVAQVVALVRLRGRPRAWSALAIPFMAWVLWVAVDAFRQEMNLWPIGLILLSPVAVLYLWGVSLVGRERSRQRAANKDRQQ